MALIDPFNRTINYLRVSITEKCNYKCSYCMPEEGAHPEGHHSEYLSFDELTKIIAAFVDLGITKVRITGGEPLVRKGVPEFVAQIHKLDGLQEIALSTNAHFLDKYAKDLKTAGLDRCNISIDTLKPKLFEHITRGGDLNKVLAGVDAGIAAGLKPMKFNCVVMQGTNDSEIEAMVDFGIKKSIEVRFIEIMPIGSAGISLMDQHYPMDKILARIKAHVGTDLIPTTEKSHAGPAKNFFIKGSNAKIGVISAVSQHFCEACNRVRLTSTGVLALCLGQEHSIDLRSPVREGVSHEELKDIIVKAMLKKPERHFFNENVHNIEFKQMVSLGG